MNISYEPSLAQHFSARNTIHLKRKALANTQEFKAKRIKNTCNRTQLKYRTENSEGKTYDSNMSLFNNPPNFKECVSECDDCEILENSELAVVVFDLETGGFDVQRHDILQICAKYGKFIFNVYITPTSVIDPKASEVHGLTRSQKTLYKNGREIFTLSIKNALNELLNFLKKYVVKKMCSLGS